MVFVYFGITLVHNKLIVVYYFIIFFKITLFVTAMARFKMYRCLYFTRTDITLMGIFVTMRAIILKVPFHARHAPSYSIFIRLLL